MRSTNKTSFAVLLSCLFGATFVGATLVDNGFATKSAVAQDRRSDRNDQPIDGGDRRRGGWWSSRQRRSDDDRDRDEQREKSSTRAGEPEESSKKGSDDAPGISNESVAKGLVEKFDANKNKVLDGEELSNLREPARYADFNKDGFITREELVVRFANPAAKAASPPAGTPTNESPKATSSGEGDDKKSGGDRGAPPETESKTRTKSKRVFTWTGGGKPGEGSKDTRRTYRFTPARERLPSELPSWFKSQDKNSDGQVSMSEYSRSWTKSTVAKFQGYDLNGDGVVTAKEVAEKK